VSVAPDDLRAEADCLRKQADALDAAAEELDGRHRKRLTESHRDAISEGVSSSSRWWLTRGGRQLSLRDLAEEAGTTASLLSQAHGGTRSIALALARKVEALTGLAATRRNWPRLRE